MIVFRYLARELLVTVAAVSAVLLVIIMSGRFIKYLAQAAQGLLDPGVLLMIMGFRLPGFLQLILPLGLFLGILLAYGRLYLDSEMTVFSATGISPRRLLLYTLAPAALVAGLVGWLSLGLTPQGIVEVDRILSQQESLTEFDTLVPGRFQALRGGARVTYTRELSEDRSELAGVFISETNLSQSGKSRGVSVLVAERGRQEVQPDGSRYLILENGHRYDGNPGQADYRAIEYETYGVLLPKPEVADEVSEREAIATRDLIGSQDIRYQSELQWRFSLPLLVFIVTLLAVPLARVNPRQGRFLKLLPAIFLYMAYLALLIAARGALDKGRIPLSLGLWWVHGLFAVIGLLLVYWESLHLWFKRRRALRGVMNGQA
ncbi:LPS export ABC transporter permease LptF [Pseudomonas sp. ABC1]|uniref:LPS export ABC transporter permease LptF n=1 Tax=Pseudomonas sp. ABC1 TaxID=2748080 RepID=UPI0015C35A5D|nr:LPS export ABC transporter permease LptF [Pseudomonas sp. ABC1]QLF92437.1 LPS export ABC transporter permease LptF [Pseudomonas sp. ABC1]